MSADPSRDATADVLSVFETKDDPAEPLTTAAVADAVEFTRDRVADRLAELSDRGDLERKQVGETCVWWQSRSSRDGGTAGRNPGSDHRRQRSFFEEVREVADIGFWEYDIRTGEAWVTDEVLEIHGLEPGSHVTPEESIEFYHPEDRPVIREAFERAIAEQEPYDLEVRLVDEQGDRRWVRTSGHAQFEDGEAVRVYGTIQDITERKEREQELQRKSRALEDAPVGVTITDPSQEDNPLIYVNERFAETTGYAREDAVGRNCRFLQGEGTNPERVAAIRQGIDDEEPVSVEIRNYRKDGTEFWNHLEIVPVRDRSGAVTNFVGFQQDVTERTERERALEKRERILRELHAATREFYPAGDMTEIAEFIVEFVANAFAFEYVSVKQYDEEDGVLRPAARSSALDGVGELGPVSPGADPIWEVYRQGDSRVFDGTQLADVYDLPDVPVNQALVVPIGDFGVTVALATEDSEFDDVDTELIDVVAANAESTFQRLRSDRVRTELVEQLSAQQTTIDELRGVIDAIQAMQRRLADSDSRDALETGVCEELLATDRVDFVWIGRPRGSDTDLEPTTWVGAGSGYLDAVEPGDGSGRLPAQRAAAEREPYCTSEIPSLVVDEAWAKEALSVDFRSVVSVPLVYDGVLYGVLTAYSRDEDAFGEIYERLLTDAASLLVNHSRLLEQRYGDSQREPIELEFELADSLYPLQRLAAETASRLRFDTVAENLAERMRVLVTVLDGDPDRVLEAVTSVNSIVDAEWFGATEHRQLALTVQKPFLASVVGKHGGELVRAVSDGSGTRFWVELPREATRRPLLDSLSSRYQEIDPVAQRQTVSQRAPNATGAADLLTDRQYEILNAAYHGGYYETPRQITGEELAATFDISSPAIYNHLQSAHRTLLETILEPTDSIRHERDGLDM